MNQDVKSKWLEALRSGEYKQGRRELKRSESFCCLGVLCDIYRKETGNGEWNSECFVLESFNWRGALPRQVVEWSGLSDKNPYIIVEGSKWPIAAVNDRGTSFTKIANIIEEQL